MLAGPIWVPVKAEYIISGFHLYSGKMELDDRAT